jgi:carboxylate-amine ligase
MHWLARRLQIFGVHIHVGVRSGDKAIPMVNALTYYVPHFLGLSPSSPYWMGRDTGLASCRSKVFEGLPTAGLPYQLSGWDEFEGFMATLISARTIQSIREVWWDVRPHPGFGTVEFRVCDGIPMLSEVAAVGAVPMPGEHLDALLDRDGKLAIPHEWVVRENKWRAARHGLKAQIIDDDHGELIPLRQSIANLVSELTPIAERLHCSDELARVLAILDRGPSYRATTRGGGCQQPPGRGRLDGRRTLRNDQLAARPPA